MKKKRSPKAKAKSAAIKRKIKTVKTKRAKNRLKAGLNLVNMPKENTKPELKTRKILENLKLPFIQQFPLAGFFYDFCLPEHRVLIEVQGDFFHASPLKYKPSERTIYQKRQHKRDKIKMAVAIRHGWRIVYVWENDLKVKARAIGENLLDFLETKPKMTMHLLEDVFPQYTEFYYKPPKKSKDEQVADKA